MRQTASVRVGELARFCLSIDNRSESMKWRDMKRNVELLDMCMCIVFAFQLIKSQRSKIRHRSEKKWREVMACDVSPVAMFQIQEQSYIYIKGILI